MRRGSRGGFGATAAPRMLRNNVAEWTLPARASAPAASTAARPTVSAADRE